MHPDATVPCVSYKRHRFPAEIISHCVWLYHRFGLSLRAPRWWPFASLVGGRPVVRQVLVRLRRAG